jgi:hypothetical protein
VIVYLFASIEAFNQELHSDVLFLVQNFSTSLQKLQSGDLIRFRYSFHDTLNTIRITRISRDTIFFDNGFILLNGIKEIRCSKDNYEWKYFTSKNEVIVPPDEVYSSREIMYDFEHWVAKNAGTKSHFNPEAYHYIGNKELRHYIFLENLDVFKLYSITENEQLRFSTADTKETQKRKIQQIQSDTVCFDSTVLLFNQFQTIYFGPKTPGIRHNPNIYEKEDSLTWIVHFPQENVYEGPYTFKKYVEELNYKLRDKKFEKKSPLVYANFVKINISKLAHVEVAFAYERVFRKRLSWETEIGYLFGFQDADAHYWINYPLYNYNGITLLTYPKSYDKRHRSYISPVFHYRYLWFNQVRTGYPEDGDVLQDQRRQDFGLSLRLGLMRRSGHFVFDLYLGFGGKYVYIHQKAYGSYLYHDSDQMAWYHQDHSPDINNYNRFQLILNAGLKIGVGFN